MAPEIAQLNSALEGRYSIDALIGRGGSASVYSATDLKHGRRVALKVFEAAVAESIGAERFLAEIRTTAALQHPHILPLFDSGEAAGRLFYAMPLVQGPSLRDRLQADGPLPVEDAVRIAIDLAEALDYAHRQGVVHRDVKPGNVLFFDGRAVLADFGIARVERELGSEGLTEAGTSLGTVLYMSPEQSVGDGKVGPASDLHALGSVLYEMLSGTAPYSAPTAQAVIGRIVSGTRTPLRTLRSSTPANVSAAVACALEQLPADRFRSGGEMAGALRDPAFRHGSPARGAAVAPASPVWRWTTLGFAASSVLLLLALGADRSSDDLQAPMEFAIGLPPGLENGAEATRFPDLAVALAPMGDALAYRGITADEDEEEDGFALFLRFFDDLTPVAVAGGGDGVAPAFSPGGDSLAFVGNSDGGIWLTDLVGGVPLRIADTGLARGSIAWSPDGWIYFTAEDSALHRVRPRGGAAPERFTDPIPETRHTAPAPIPGGGLLFRQGRYDIGTARERSPYRRAEADSIAVVGPEGGQARVLVEGTMARYAPSGHLVYTALDATLMAVRFDSRTLEIEGEPIAIGPRIHGWLPNAQFDVAPDGTAFYFTWEGTQNFATYEPVWVSRAGEAEAIDEGWTIPVNPGHTSLNVSPDGRKIQIALPREGSLQYWHTWDLYVRDVGSGLIDLIAPSSADRSTRASWVQGDVIFSRMFGNGTARYPAVSEIVRAKTDGSAQSEIVLAMDGYVQEPHQVGEWIVFRHADSQHNRIFGFREGMEEARLLFDEGAASETPRLSPNGRWLAYTSQVTGRREVYLRPFDDPASRRIPVSGNGGQSADWSLDGTELFYVDGAGDVVAVQIRSGDDPIGSRERLFSFAPYFRSASSRSFSVGPDGRFAMLRLVGRPQDELEPRGVVVQNFDDRLRTILPR